MTSSALSSAPCAEDAADDAGDRTSEHTHGVECWGDAPAGRNLRFGSLRGDRAAARLRRVVSTALSVLCHVWGRVRPPGSVSLVFRLLRLPPQGSKLYELTSGSYVKIDDGVSPASYMCVYKHSSYDYIPEDRHGVRGTARRSAVPYLQLLIKTYKIQRPRSRSRLY